MVDLLLRSRLGMPQQTSNQRIIWWTPVTEQGDREYLPCKLITIILANLLLIIVRFRFYLHKALNNNNTTTKKIHKKPPRKQQEEVNLIIYYLKILVNNSECDWDINTLNVSYRYQGTWAILRVISWFREVCLIFT